MKLKLIAVCAAAVLTTAFPALGEMSQPENLQLKMTEDILHEDGNCPARIILSRKTERFEGGASFHLSGKQFSEFSQPFTLKSLNNYTAIFEGKLASKYSSCRGIASNEQDAPHVKVKFLKNGNVQFVVDLDPGSEISKAAVKNKVPEVVWSIAD